MKKRQEPLSDPDAQKHIAAERKNWRDGKRLAPGSLADFQERADEAFRDLMRKYEAPSALSATMKRRAQLIRKRGKAG